LPVPFTQVPKAVSEHKSANSYGLAARAVACESLVFLLELLDLMRPAIQQLLPAGQVRPPRRALLGHSSRMHACTLHACTLHACTRLPPQPLTARPAKPQRPLCEQFYSRSHRAVKQLRRLMYRSVAGQLLDTAAVCVQIEQSKWDLHGLSEDCRWCSGCSGRSGCSGCSGSVGAVGAVGAGSAEGAGSAVRGGWGAWVGVGADADAATDSDTDRPAHTRTPTHLSTFPPFPPCRPSTP
jgi:hypothetical protein